MWSEEEQSSLQLVEGDILDKYSLTRRLGVGGMGEVWLAEDPALERQVAVKLLLPEYSSDPQFRERFRREAQTMMDLQNAPIVGVMNYFEADEPRTGRLLAAMVMQYMPGGTLEDRMEPGGVRRPLPLDEALETAAAALEALDEIHDAGIVHRDLKPSNFLFTSAGKVRVSDFGIAIAAQSDQRLTQARSIIGTATYMSPEQAIGEFELDRRSDIYSFGVVLFEMLTGYAPFHCDDQTSSDAASEIRRMHLQAPPPSIEGVDAQLDPWLDRVIGKALGKRREDRWQTCDEFRKAVEAVRRRDEAALRVLLGASATARTPTQVVGAGTGTQVLSADDLTPSPPSPPPVKKRSPVLLAGAAVLLLPALYGLGQFGVISLPAGLLGDEALLEQARGNLEANNDCRAHRYFQAYADRKPDDASIRADADKAYQRCDSGGFHKAQAMALELGDPCGSLRAAEEAAKHLNRDPEVEAHRDRLAGACDPGEADDPSS